MKRTYAEIREFYGLKIGDKIKVELCGDEPLEVLEDCLKKNEYCNYSFSVLENAEYTILEAPKKEGDLLKILKNYLYVGGDSITEKIKIKWDSIDKITNEKDFNTIKEWLENGK